MSKHSEQQETQRIRNNTENIGQEIERLLSTLQCISDAGKIKNVARYYADDAMLGAMFLDKIDGMIFLLGNEVGE